MSFRKSSKRRNGSNSEVLPKPKARRKCTPAPSMAGFALIMRLIGRKDILFFLDQSLNFSPVEHAVNLEILSTCHVSFPGCLDSGDLVIWVCSSVLCLAACVRSWLGLKRLA